MKVHYQDTIDDLCLWKLKRIPRLYSELSDQAVGPNDLSSASALFPSGISLGLSADSACSPNRCFNGSNSTTYPTGEPIFSCVDRLITIEPCGLNVTYRSGNCAAASPLAKTFHSDPKFISACTIHATLLHVNCTRRGSASVDEVLALCLGSRPKLIMRHPLRQIRRRPMRQATRICRWFCL